MEDKKDFKDKVRQAVEKLLLNDKIAIVGMTAGEGSFEAITGFTGAEFIGLLSVVKYKFFNKSDGNPLIELLGHLGKKKQNE